MYFMSQNTLNVSARLINFLCSEVEYVKFLWGKQKVFLFGRMRTLWKKICSLVWQMVRSTKQPLVLKLNSKCPSSYRFISEWMADINEFSSICLMQMLSFAWRAPSEMIWFWFWEKGRYMFKSLPSISERICFFSAFEKCCCFMLAFIKQWVC